MSEIPADLLAAALQLPEDAREELADRLYESLGPPDAGDVDAAWAEEIMRRMLVLESGREKAIPLDEVWKIILDDSDASDAD